jgi:ribosomal protein S27E
LATSELSASGSAQVQQLPNHKVKVKKGGQRACNEKDAKGKFCGGHLKRWFYTNDAVECECGDIEKAWGQSAEVYRCENCKTLYLPTPGEAKVNVAGQGMISVFGLTLPPKEK